MDPEIVKQMMQNGQLGSTPSQTQMPSTAAFSPNQAYVEMPYKAVTVQQPFTLDLSQYPTREQVEEIYNNRVAQRIENTLPGQSWSITEKLQYMDPVELKLYEDLMREYELKKIKSDMDYNDKAYNVNAMNQTTYNRVKDYGGLVDGLYPTVYFSASPENNYGVMPELPKLEELSKSDQFSISREGASGTGNPKIPPELFVTTTDGNGLTTSINIYDHTAKINSTTGLGARGKNMKSCQDAVERNTMTTTNYDYVVSGHQDARRTNVVGLDGPGAIAETDKVFWGIVTNYTTVKKERGNDAARLEARNAGERYAKALGYSNDDAGTFAEHFAGLIAEVGVKLAGALVTESNMKFKITNPNSTSQNPASQIQFTPDAFTSLTESIRNASAYLTNALLDYKPNVASYTPKDEFTGSVNPFVAKTNGRNRLREHYYSLLNAVLGVEYFDNITIGQQGESYRKVTTKDITKIMSNN